MTASKLFRVESFVAGLAIKAPCHVATTAPITLAGEQTVNNRALTAGMRCLVKNQASAVENGVYSVETSAWKRAGDFDGNRDVVGGTIVPVYDVTQDLFLFYVVDGDATALTPDVDSFTFSFLPLAGTSVDEQIQINNAFIDNSTVDNGRLIYATIETIDFDVNAYAVVANAVNFNCNEGQVGTIDLSPATGTVTLSITNVPAPVGRYFEIQMDIIQASGGHNITWPAGVKWPGGTAPTITATTGAIDVVHLWTRDGGSTWYGTFMQDFS